MKYQGLFLSGSLFDGPTYGNIERVMPGLGQPLGILEGTAFGIKLCIYDGEVLNNLLYDKDVLKTRVKEI